MRPRLAASRRTMHADVGQLADREDAHDQIRRTTRRLATGP